VTLRLTSFQLLTALSASAIESPRVAAGGGGVEGGGGRPLASASFLNFPADSLRWTTQRPILLPRQWAC
jgi:hypothetical protein